MCNISWLISVDRAVPRRVDQRPVSEDFQPSSSFHHPHCLCCCECSFLIADSCLWGLKNSLLSKAYSSVEWLLGHWDFNNDLREVSTQDLLTVWRIALQHKGQSRQWEAVNREIFIKVLTPPLRSAGTLTGTTNTEASIPDVKSLFFFCCCGSTVSVLESELLETNSKGWTRSILKLHCCFGPDNVSVSPLYLADRVLVAQNAEALVSEAAIDPDSQTPLLSRFISTPDRGEASTGVTWQDH